MYKNFFGFKERPFQLVPNPAYLFLSRSHEEALAHLTYAISQGDGFVEITGEVGTGKTTLCRTFLEGLDHSTEAAYIFNPNLDSIQLLKTINDEFGISSEGDNTKDLIDTLNTFLMEKKGEGKKVILLIDEAQNLSKEVLEQLRLLSNLETTTSKLLQIILVGQPELGEMLDSHELRQLGQRITLSCHLNPLTYRETREYIRHRIHVASQKSGVRFSRGALRSIYRYSGGIPRLINISCDRTLLTAFGLNRQKITGGIARAAVRELAGRGDIKRFSLTEGNRSFLLLGLLCIALVLLVFYRPGNLNINGLFQAGGGGPAAVPPPVKEAPKEAPKSIETPGPGTVPSTEARTGEQGRESPVSAPAPVAVEAPASQVQTLQTLEGLLKEMDPRISRTGALKAALQLWKGGYTVNRYMENLADDQSFFRLGAKQNGLLVLRVKGDMELLKKLNLPAVLELQSPGDLSPRYLVLSGLDGGKAVLRVGTEGGIIETEVDRVMSVWSGVAYIPWKNFLDYEGTIPINAPRDSIITLKMLMQDIGFNDLEISPDYDEKTRNAVQLIQERHGLRVDGLVGPLTKIVLYNEKKSLGIPHIVKP